MLPLHRRPLWSSPSSLGAGPRAQLLTSKWAAQQSSSPILFRSLTAAGPPAQVYLKRQNQQQDSVSTAGNQTPTAVTPQWASLTAMGPQACHTSSLSLSLFICKMGITVPTPQDCCKDRSGVSEGTSVSSTPSINGDSHSRCLAGCVECQEISGVLAFPLLLHRFAGSRSWHRLFSSPRTLL